MAKTIRRILKSANLLIGQRGFRASTMQEVAREAGVSEDDLQNLFHSKEGLLMETQRAFFRALHQRFLRRAQSGDQGVRTALDALDAIWQSIRDLKAGAPFIVETLSLGGKQGPMQTHIQTFYRESTELLEDGIRKVFANNENKLVIPPERLAVLIRILLSGLIIELAQANSEQRLMEVDQAYADARHLFRSFVLQPELSMEYPDFDENTDSVPLPW